MTRERGPDGAAKLAWPVPEGPAAEMSCTRPLEGAGRRGLCPPGQLQASCRVLQKGTLCWPPPPLHRKIPASFSASSCPEDHSLGPSARGTLPESSVAVLLTSSPPCFSCSSSEPHAACPRASESPASLFAPHLCPCCSLCMELPPPTSSPDCGLSRKFWLPSFTCQRFVRHHFLIGPPARD